MPALKNAKHEKFAQEIAKGASQIDAYVAAGYVAHEGSASRLRSSAKVAARIAELQERTAKRTEVTAAGITERLMRIADVLEAAGVQVGPDGRLAKASSQHLSVARAALMDAAKLNGLVVDQSSLSVNLTSAQRSARIAELMARRNADT